MKTFVRWILPSLFIIPLSAAWGMGESSLAVQCDPSHDRVLIRFGFQEGGEFYKSTATDDPVAEPLPPVSAEFAGDVTKAAVQVDQADCRLADGRRVRVSRRVGAAFAYGAGGADPDTFITLEIDNKQIYLKYPFYLGYGVGKFALNAILLDRQKLWECPRAAAPLGARACTDQSHRLTGDAQALTPKEKQALAESRRNEELTAKLSPWCEHFASPTFRWAIERIFARQFLDDSQRELAKADDFRIVEVRLDLNHDGKPEEWWWLQSLGTHFFDGSVPLVFPAGLKNAKAAAAALTGPQGAGGRLLTEEGAYKTFTTQTGAQGLPLTIPEAGNRYVYHVPFSFRGQTYLYAYPSNADRLPSATISELDARYRAKTLCAFPAAEALETWRQRAPAPGGKPPGAPLAASFDCRHARTAPEQAICADADLAQLDRELNEIYKDRLRRAAGAPERADKLKSLQKEFLKERDRCGHRPACLKSVLTDKLILLNGGEDDENVPGR
jgi:hypothetical protein